jgi:hypothetical protein
VSSIKMLTNIIMDLKTSDLYQKHDQLIQLKKATYDKLYQRCVNSVKLTASSGELCCFFKIPQFLFGSSYPIINVNSCANYIMNKLVQSNEHIKTSFIEPDIIFIDWRREEDYQNLSIFEKSESRVKSDTRSDMKSRYKGH